MKKWILKAVVQKTISFLPQREKINYFFQRYITKGVLLTDTHFEIKLTSARDHINYFSKYRDEQEGPAEILELGTGWYPVIPLSLYLTSDVEVTSVDARRWLTKNRFMLTIQKFMEWQSVGKLDSFLPSVRQDKWEQLLEIYRLRDRLSLKDISDRLDFSLIVGDARSLSVADGTFDFICSNNTFEHIPEDILAGILTEFKRVLKPGGVMSHFIDLSDHFAHFDKTIGIYNFLRFSDRQWRIIDNSIQPQNRLRFRDYKEMYSRLGIEIIEENYSEGDQKALKALQLDEKYLLYRPEELAISHGYLISKKQRPGNK